MSILSDWLQLTNFADIGGGSGYSYNAWQTAPADAQIQDGTYTWADAFSDYPYTNWLRATGVVNPLVVGKVPVGAAIRGVEVGIYVQGQQSASIGSFAAPVRCQLVRGDSSVGNVLTGYANHCIGSTCWSLLTIGGPTELFGLNVTRDDLKSSGFGVAIQGVYSGPSGDAVMYQVDWVTMRFYYDQVGMFMAL